MTGFLIFSLGSSLAFAADSDPGRTSTFKIIPPAGAGIAVDPASAAGGNVGRILKNVISIFYVIGGIGVIIYVLWGAVEWIFSGGDKERVGNARKKITHALIGLVLLSMSFVIINFVGRVVGFNPLGCLQIPYLDSPDNPALGGGSC